MMAALQIDARERLPLALVAAASAACGVAMALRASAVPVVAVTAAVALIALQWRTGVLVLLATLPFAGVPALMMGAAGLAFRDVAIVTPLYVAFAIAMTSDRADDAWPRLGWTLPVLGVFTLLVMLYTPLAPTPLAGAIGAKVWLAYVPMLVIGYRFIERPADFERVARLTALLALVPASIGIAEWALASTRGDFGAFEALYAHAGIDEGQRFVGFDTPAGQITIPRVPSLFTSVTQYFCFMLVAFACSLSMAFARRNVRWTACAAALGIAAMLSGARAAYVAVPAVLVLSCLLNGGLRGSMNAALAAIGIGIGVAVFAAGNDVGGIAAAVPGHAGVTLDHAWGEMASSMRVFGHGTGWDTNAALRYGGVAEQRYIENWYAKATLELGVAGLCAILIAIGSMQWALVRSLMGGDARTRAIAAPVVAMLIVTSVLLFKGPYVDLDPMNVYFWLLAGMLAGVVRKRPEAASLETAR